MMMMLMILTCCWSVFVPPRYTYTYTHTQHLLLAQTFMRCTRTHARSRTHAHTCPCPSTLAGIHTKLPQTTKICHFEKGIKMTDSCCPTLELKGSRGPLCLIHKAFAKHSLIRQSIYKKHSQSFRNIYKSVVVMAWKEN